MVITVCVSSQMALDKVNDKVSGNTISKRAIWDVHYSKSSSITPNQKSWKNIWATFHKTSK